MLLVLPCCVARNANRNIGRRRYFSAEQGTIQDAYQHYKLYMEFTLVAER
jgi:hypothetical protein